MQAQHRSRRLKSAVRRKTVERQVADLTDRREPLRDHPLDRLHVRQQGALLAQQHAHVHAGRQGFFGGVGEQAIARNRDQLREGLGQQGEVRQVGIAAQGLEHDDLVVAATTVCFNQVQIDTSRTI